MFRPFVFALALLGASTPALACQCEDPTRLSDAKRERHAKWIADAGGSIAEVELVRTQFGDRYRTLRHLFGERRAWYSVRSPTGPVTSCDYGITPGNRAIMVFLPRPGSGAATAPCKSPAAAARKGYIPAGMCTQLFIQAAGNLELVRRSAVR